MGFTEKHRIMTLSGFLVLIVILIVCVNKSNMFAEHFAEVSEAPEASEAPIAAEDHDNETHASVSSNIQEQPVPSTNPSTNIPSCLPKDQLMPQELLPQDTPANQWSLANPQGSGSLKDKNFLQAGYHVGINTVGQTLRNANMQLRSDPPNPQVQVSPWLQTTINPDTNRKPMEIGGCA